MPLTRISSSLTGLPPDWATRLKTGQLGAAWMLVAAFFFALMASCVKLGAVHHGAVELVFWRTLFGMVSLGAVAGVRRQSLLTPNWWVQVKRGLFGYVSLVCYFSAMTELSISTAVTLNYSSSIFLALLSVLMLGERLTPKLLLSLGLGLVGVALLLRPSIGAGQWQSGMIGLGSGLMAAFAYLHVRELGQLGEPDWRTVFWFTGLATVCGGVWLLLSGGFRLPTAESVWPLLGMGITATLAQLAMTRAYSQGDKLVASALAYCTVAFTALAGALLFGDRLDLPAVAAIVLIVVSGLIAARR